jgi:hypothetical protein
MSINYTENPKIIAMKKTCMQMYQRAKRRSSPTLLERSKALARKIYRLVNTNRKQWIEMSLESRSTWTVESLQQSGRKNSRGLPRRNLYEDISNTTPEEKAAAFLQFFRRKVETIKSDTSINWGTDVRERVLFEPEANIFTLKIIMKVMTELKPKTYFGYDNPILLDQMEYLLAPLHTLLNMIYNQNVIPDQ